MSRMLHLAMVTAHKNCFRATGNTVICGDFWNMYYWLNVMGGGDHYSFDSVKDDMSVLNKYDVVIISGNPGYITQVRDIGDKLKNVTVFFPEGDASLYHDKGINPILIEAWNSCSIMGIVEEDKVPFYSSISHRPVKFLHIPVPNLLTEGYFRTGCGVKNENILVYGDRNPNNALVAIGVAKRLKKPITCTAIDESTLEWIQRYLGVKVIKAGPKQDQFDYFRHYVAISKVLVYPTRWIGTARQVISGAICGTPVVGNRDSHTQKRLFPKLGTYMYDVDKMCELVTRLYTEPEFYVDVVEQACEALKFYSEDRAKERLIDAYDCARRVA